MLSRLVLVLCPKYRILPHVPFRDNSQDVFYAIQVGLGLIVPRTAFCRTFLFVISYTTNTVPALYTWVYAVIGDAQRGSPARRPRRGRFGRTRAPPQKCRQTPTRTFADSRDAHAGQHRPGMGGVSSNLARFQPFNGVQCQPHAIELSVSH